MRGIWILLLAGLMLLAGCALKGQTVDGPGTVNSYRQIDQETAKQMMEQDDGHIIVDVRRLDEFESGHIPGAICIPNESIAAEQPEELPNPQQTVLIYCRSGNRSKQASEKLFNMGYSNIYEFGGIIDWTGETVTGQTLLLRVESNPTTGFSWAAAQDRELFDVESIYTAGPQAEPLSGAGGWQSFILTPKQAGTARVSFRYSRPWEPSDADPQFGFSFEISEELRITVTQDGSAEAASQGYPATIKIY